MSQLELFQLDKDLSCFFERQEPVYRHDGKIFMEGGYRDPVLRKVQLMWKRAKDRAREKELPFNITKADILTEWPPHNICPALGIELHIAPKAKDDPDYGYAVYNSASLDRIIPERGYVKHNIAVVSSLANNIMSYATPRQVIKVAEYYNQKYYEVKDKLNV